MKEMGMYLPKLKAYSLQHNNQSKTPTSHLKTISTTENHKINFDTNETANRGSSLKYKYINKSPKYFKNQQMSSPSLFVEVSQTKTIEDYVGQQIKQVHKLMLIDLAKSKLRKHRMKKMDRWAGDNTQNTGIDRLHLMKESKYENFRPERIPINYTLKLIKHPSLLCIKEIQ